MDYNILNHTDNGLVVFCGAGVSMVAPTCLPSWWQMNEQVVNSLSVQVEPFCGKDFASNIAVQINNRRDNNRFPPEFQAEIINAHYGKSYFKVLKCLDSEEPNYVHTAIVELARMGYIKAIVTTNFDRLFELEFKKSKVPLDVHFQAEHFENLAQYFEQPKHQLTQCQLLKLHGSVEDHNTLVDTLAQRMIGFSPAINSCIRYLLRNHYWLFLGYSGADLAAKSQYLCLNSEVDRAVGFCWLVRDSSKKEPFDAIIKIKNLYKDKAQIIRGELPTWIQEHFNLILPKDFPAPPLWSKEKLKFREQMASNSIIEHTRKWSEDIGGIRSALVLSHILEQSISNPQASIELLGSVLKTLEPSHESYIVVAHSYANILMKMGELDKAMKFEEEILIKVNPENQEHYKAILTTLGNIEIKRGNNHEALKHFEKAYEISVLLNDEDKSVFLHNLGMALESLGKYDKAILCYEKALEIVQRLGDTIAQAETLNNIGNLLRKQDKYYESIKKLEEAILLRERLGDDVGVGTSLGNIASVYHLKGDITAAKSTYEKALAIFQHLGNQPLRASTMLNLGKINQELREFTEAKRLYEEAIALSKENGIEKELASGLWNLASLFRDNPIHKTEAQSLYDEALNYYKNNGDRSGEADVMNEIGILLWRNDQLGQAAATFEKVIDIRIQLNQPMNHMVAIGNLALVLKDQGRLEEAFTMMQKELTIAEQLQAKGVIANTYYNIGALQLQQGSIETAVVSLKKSLQLYKKMGATNQSIEILSILGEVYSKEGKIGVGLQWFDQAIQLSNSVELNKTIGERLINVLKTLVENGFIDIARIYGQRLNSIGFKVEINKV